MVPAPVGNVLDDFLATRPRLLNVLHAAGLARPATQTSARELDCLRSHAANRRTAVEIGTFQGVSAAVIAGALAPDGVLYCVDPWEPVDGRENPIFSIARRHLRARGRRVRIEYVQAFSHAAAARIPTSLDFAFIDGDHSYEGLRGDWDLIAARVTTGGVVCLHDTTVPPEEPHRMHGSVRYFDEVIRHDPRFEHLETVYSLNVLRRSA